MNNARRKKIDALVQDLRVALEKLDEYKLEERDAFENMPENLQASEKGQAAEEDADALDEAYYSLDSAIGSLEEAIQ